MPVDNQPSFLCMNERQLDQQFQKFIVEDEANFKKETYLRSYAAKNEIRKAVESEYMKAAGVGVGGLTFEIRQKDDLRLQGHTISRMSQTLRKQLLFETVKTAIDCSQNHEFFQRKVQKNKKKQGDGQKKKSVKADDGSGVYWTIRRYRNAGELMSENDLFEEKGQSSKLGTYLNRAGDPKPLGHRVAAAHHIVASNARSAERTRETLADLGIRINDPVNGVYLPLNSKCYEKYGFDKAQCHSSLHTEIYYVRVDSWIQSSQTRHDVCKGLYKIKSLLLKGMFIN